LWNNLDFSLNYSDLTIFKMAHVCRLEFYGFNNGFFEKLIGRQHRSFRFSENRVFVRILATNKQTNKQTDGQHQCVKPPSLSQEAA